MSYPTLPEQLSSFNSLGEVEQRECLYWLRQFPDMLLRLTDPPVKLVIEAVSVKGLLLQHVKRQTTEICMAAVSQNGMSLAYVDVQSADICKAAVCNAPQAIQFVIDRTVELEAESISRMPDALACIEHPADATVYLALALDPLALQHLRVQELRFCEFAVRRDPAALKFVRNQTPELAALAIARDPVALEFVLPEIQTEALCRQAVERNPLAAMNVHDPNLREQLLTHLTRGSLQRQGIESLIRDDPDYFIHLWYLDPRFWQDELLELALVHHGERLMSGLWEIGHPLPESLVLNAMSRDGTLLRYVVEENLCMPVCLAAVSQTPEALAYVPQLFLKQCFERSFVHL